MTAATGILAAGISLLAWGFGDFALQRTTRKVPIPCILFGIGIAGVVLLLPFSLHDLPLLHGMPLLRVTAAALLLFGASSVGLTAFRKGKLSVIEPILSLELVVAILTGWIVLHERLTGMQLLLAGFVLVGVILVSYREKVRAFFFFKRRVIEYGVGLALIGAFFQGLQIIMYSVASRELSPITAVWAIHVVVMVIACLWLWQSGGWKNVIPATTATPFVFPAVILPNVAWVAYGYAVIQFQIGLTAAMVESYIALAALLGVVWNKEKLQRHQYAGMILAIAAAIVLAAVSE